MKTVVYACDDNYAGLTAVSAVSVLRWNPGTRIVVIGLHLKDDSVALVRSRVEKSGGVFDCFDASEQLESYRKRGLAGYTSFAIYARFLIADVLSDCDGRVLYLDCDTLVRGSVDELFDMPLNGRPFAFGYDCICHAYKRFVRVPADAPYYNSGVMLADLAAWRKSDAMRVLARELAAPTGPVSLPDQDVIARSWRDFIQPLDPKWNFLSQFILYDYGCVRRITGKMAPFATRLSYESAQRDPVICHFSGHTLGRPWYTSSKHPMRAEYIEAARRAGLESLSAQVRPMLWMYGVQYWLWKLLPHFLFHPIGRLMLRVSIKMGYGV